MVASRLVVLWIATTLVAEAVAQPTEPSAAERLESLGLERQGAAWEQKSEPRLQRRLAELPELRQRILQRRRALATLAEENQRRWTQLQPQRTQLEAQRKSAADSQQRREAERRLAAVLREATPPDQLAASPVAAPLLAELVDWELRAAAQLLWTQRAMDELVEAHRRLQLRADVQAALRSLGHQLSPPSRYRDAAEIIEQGRRQVLGGTVPYFIQSGRLRLGALLNESVPATVTWDPQGERHWISSTLAAAAELESRPGAAVRLDVSGRKLLVRPVRIRKLRLGQTVLTDVAAWRLPPEGEDLGSTLGGYALQQCTLRALPQTLRVRVTAAP